VRVLVLGSFVPQTARTVWRLLAAGHEIEEVWLGENSGAVWRRRDRRLRWLAPTWSIESAVRRCGIRVRQVGSLRRDLELVANGCRPHVDAVLASCFPYIIPRSMLAYYHGRAFNLHPALLPRYRGPSPMTAMVFDEALDAAGVTLHLMTPGIDEGDVVAHAPVGWPADGWFRTWEADLAEASGRLAAEVLPQFLAGRIAATPQAGPAHYVKSLPASGLEIDGRVDERRARWLAGSLGRITPLKVVGGAAPIDAGLVLRSRGAPTGRRPQASLRHVECDVADARLTLRRWDGWHRRAERLRELAGLARRPLSHSA
jgi:methionyl-tRNA formyltransferase